MVTGVHWLDNGVLRLGVFPALGRRLLSLRHKGFELLLRNLALLAPHRAVTTCRPSPAAPTSAGLTCTGIVGL